MMYYSLPLKVIQNTSTKFFYYRFPSPNTIFQRCNFSFEQASPY